MTDCCSLGQVTNVKQEADQSQSKDGPFPWPQKVKQKEKRMTVVMQVHYAITGSGVGFTKYLVFLPEFCSFWNVTTWKIVPII